MRRRRRVPSEPPYDADHYQFDVHLAHACNFSCESCSHFSNYHFSGVLTLEVAEVWYQKWATRLRPFRINLLGGEPAINPKFSEHVLLARRYWPSARLRIYTNGFLLHRHPQLPEAMQMAGNTILELSKHYDSQEYLARFEAVVRMVQFWRAQHGIDFEIVDSFKHWTRRYIDDNGTLRPYHDNNPQQSWSTCRAKHCIQMHDGKLWKCPMLAYLPMAKRQLNLSPEWDYYLTYRALDADCSEGQLKKFLTGSVEPYCAACPTQSRPFQKSNPMAGTVSRGVSVV